MCNINLNSPRIIKALKIMYKRDENLEKLKITLQEIEELRRYGLKIEHLEETDSYYINTTSVENVIVESYKSKTLITEKWLEISDLWVGSSFFDEESLRFVLTKAEKEGFLNVYIAGNLTFGHPQFLNNKDTIQQRYKTSYKQAEYLIDIFSDFPGLKYYAVHGSRDKSFEKHGELNPLLFIQKGLKDKNVDFTYIDNYTANILINGGIKRVTSLEKNRDTYTKSYPIDLYVRKQLSNIGGNIIKDNVNYKIRCLQVGNVLFDSYDYTANMYITTSSGFIFDTQGGMQTGTAIPSATFCIVEFQESKITRFNATIVRLPRTLKRC